MFLQQSDGGRSILGFSPVQSRPLVKEASATRGKREKQNQLSPETEAARSARVFVDSTTRRRHHHEIRRRGSTSPSDHSPPPPPPPARQRTHAATTAAVQIAETRLDSTISRGEHRRTAPPISSPAPAAACIRRAYATRHDARILDDCKGGFPVKKSQRVEGNMKSHGADDRGMMQAGQKHNADCIPSSDGPPRATSTIRASPCRCQYRTRMLLPLSLPKRYEHEHADL